jgi:hypothetical protein
VLEGVLDHVVVDARRQRRVDLGLRLEQLRDRAFHALDRRMRGPLEAPRVADLGQHLLRRRAQPRVAQARGQRRLQVHAGHHERLRELRRAGQHAALVVDQHRMPVEDQLVLSADDVAERHRGEVVARALGEHPLALEALVAVIGRGGRVEDQRRPGLGLVGRGRARHPHVLADREPDARAAEVDHGGARAGLEIALLVAHAVVPEPHLAVAGAHRAVGEHRERVEGVLGALRVADDGDDPLGTRRELREAFVAGPQEVLLEQQVLGRVAGEHELAEEDELGAGVARLLDAARDLRDVALDVAHARVDLGEGDAQRGETFGHHD